MRATAEEVARLRAAVEKLANETAADRAARVRFPNCGSMIIRRRRRRRRRRRGRRRRKIRRIPWRRADRAARVPAHLPKVWQGALVPGALRPP